MLGSAQVSTSVFGSQTPFPVFPPAASKFDLANITGNQRVSPGFLLNNQIVQLNSTKIISSTVYRNKYLVSNATWSATAKCLRISTNDSGCQCSHVKSSRSICRTGMTDRRDFSTAITVPTFIHNTISASPRRCKPSSAVA